MKPWIWSLLTAGCIGVLLLTSSYVFLGFAAGYFVGRAVSEATA